MLQIISVVQTIYLQAVNSSKTSECIGSYPGDTISIKPPKIFKHVYSNFIYLMLQQAIKGLQINSISSGTTHKKTSIQYIKIIKK